MIDIMYGSTDDGQPLSTDAAFQSAVSTSAQELMIDGKSHRMVDPVHVENLERRLAMLERKLADMSVEISNLRANNLYRKNDILRLQSQLDSKISRE